MALKMVELFRVEVKVTPEYAFHTGLTKIKVQQPQCIPTPGSMWIVIGECVSKDLSRLQMDAVNLISGDLDPFGYLGSERIRCQIVQSYWTEE